MNELIKKVSKMELGNPVITALVGLVVFYIGLKMFSGGMKSMGNLDHLKFFLGNPIYMFVGGIVMTLLWHLHRYLPLQSQLLLQVVLSHYQQPLPQFLEQTQELLVLYGSQVSLYQTVCRKAILYEQHQHTVAQTYLWQ